MTDILTKCTEVIFRVKLTSAQVVETSVTNNSSSQNYSHPDDHTIRTTDTPGFKPLILLCFLFVLFQRGIGKALTTILSYLSLK